MFVPFIPDQILKKISIHGHTDFAQPLLNAIPSSQLPTFLGGAMTDADGNPDCLWKVATGGVVPEPNAVPEIAYDWDMRDAAELAKCARWKETMTARSH
jgi:hypothetical protein